MFKLKNERGEHKIFEYDTNKFKFREFIEELYNTNDLEHLYNLSIDYNNLKNNVNHDFNLNDVETGGNTVFKDFMIQPKKGSLLVFPPLWMFPHKGEPPISGPKYIMSTYLHYK